MGWVTLSALNVPPAAEPTLTVAATNTALETLRRISGSGATQRRTEALIDLLRQATPDEQRFLVRLLGGELRRGALEGVTLEAVASAAQLDAETVRRAFMSSGELPITAEAALRGSESALAGFRLRVGRPLRPMLASPAEPLGIRAR